VPIGVNIRSKSYSSRNAVKIRLNMISLRFDCSVSNVCCERVWKEHEAFDSLPDQSGLSIDLIFVPLIDSDKAAIRNHSGHERHLANAPLETHKTRLRNRFSTTLAAKLHPEIVTCFDHAVKRCHGLRIANSAQKVNRYIQKLVKVCYLNSINRIPRLSNRRNGSGSLV